MIVNICIFVQSMKFLFIKKMVDPLYVELDN